MQRAHFRSIDEVVLIDIECNEVLFVPCNIVIFFLVASTVTSTSSVKEFRMAANRLLSQAARAPGANHFFFDLEGSQMCSPLGSKDV